LGKREQRGNISIDNPMSLIMGKDRKTLSRVPGGESIMSTINQASTSSLVLKAKALDNDNMAKFMRAK